MSAGTADQILQRLHSLGVTITVVDGRRLRLEPANRVPDDLIPSLRSAKLAILDVLKSRPLTRGESGCESARGPQEDCHHCNGAGECSCPACTLRRTTKAVPCLMCQPRQRQAWLAATRPEGHEQFIVPV